MAQFTCRLIFGVSKSWCEWTMAPNGTDDNTNLDQFVQHLNFVGFFLRFSIQKLEAVELPQIKMGLDHFDEPAIRQRNIASNYSDTKIASDLNNNGNVNSEDQFDAEITTLNNNNNAKEAIANAENLPQDLANEKLKEIGAATPILPSEIGTDFNFKREIVWSNAIGFLVLHLCAVFGVGLGLFGFADYRTIVYCECIIFCCCLPEAFVLSAIRKSNKLTFQL